MNGKLNKILAFAGIFCGSVAFSQAFADDNTDMSNDSTSSTTTTTSYNQITPPAGFASAAGIGFSLSADFIYWEARQANLDFAQSGVVNTETIEIDSQGQTYYPGFQYQPGFKVGAAVDLGHDNWDLSAEYTWLNGSGEKTSTSAPYATTTLTNTRNIYADTGTHLLIEADGNWGFHYNFIDLVMGRDYYISQNLTLRPYFGLAGAWNNQSSLVHYTYASSSTVNETFISQSYGQKYWGVGFDSGINTAWCFDDNWSIYGDFSVMNLWSRFKTYEKETNYDYNTDGTVDYTNPNVDYNTEAVQYGLQNVIDIQMGIRWGMRFDDDAMGISFQAGWDQQVWINHAKYATNASNLSIQGLDIKARFDF